MTWTRIGTLNPTYDWQDIGLAIVGDNILRFTWQWNGPADFPGRAKLWVAQVFTEDSWHNFQAIYASKNSRILVYNVASELTAAGLGIYVPRFKLSNNSRFSINGDLTVFIDEWQGQTNPITGGEYE